MPKPNYISLEINGVKADIDPAGQIPTVSYALEDQESFEQKKSAESFDIELPATLINDQIHNTLHNSSVLDGTTDQSYDNFKPAKYIANGQEILIGKYLQQSVIKNNGRPVKYKGKIYGLNGDWVVDLKEKTLHDFLNPLAHNFDVASIVGSWDFDGRNEQADFVYAPARYRKRFGAVPAATIDEPNPVPPDNNAILNDMKPAISVYWLLYRAFKSVGYRIVSTFMDLDYYRRGVMPWTWGGFDYIDDTRWEALKFLAGTNDQNKPNGYSSKPTWPTIKDFTGYPDVYATDDASLKPGAYDNSALFEYLGSGSTLPYLMKWQYPTSGPLVLGNVIAAFKFVISHRYFVNLNSDAELRVRWYKNGIQVQDDEIFAINANGPNKSGEGYTELYYETPIAPGDYVGVRVYTHVFNSIGSASSSLSFFIESFELDFLKLGVGSTVSLKGNYPKFKNYKWIDLLRGEIDLFDLSIQTDPIRKEVYIEPTHAYEVDGVKYPGYYNREQLDFSQKVDISKDSELEIFSDYERELYFKFQPDDNDGGLKKVQDRNQATIGMAKYLLPSRYKSEAKEQENRFYSPVMHGEITGFKSITGIAPQMICIIPENISNTSSSESENTYNPKRAYYKGKVTGFGGFVMEGNIYPYFPFMFAVNYKQGGENDPVLSYADQLIGGIVAQGLLKKFFVQRMAILRHGRRYNPIFCMLNNTDVSNFLHRESWIIGDIEYILTAIQDYDPITPQSTACKMWAFIPKGQLDLQNIYPSLASIQSGSQTGSFDVKYWAHLLLSTDIV